MRVNDVQTALGELLVTNGSGRHATTVFDPRSLRVHIRREGDAAVLEAVDAKHSDPLPILTVTDNDAKANGSSIDALAAQWQGILQSALIRALELRQPSVEKRSLQRVAFVAGIVAAVSLLVIVILRFLWRRMEGLETEIAARNRTVAQADQQAPEKAAADKTRRRTFAIALQNLEPAQRLSLYGAFAETLMWALLLAWFITITWSLSLFAATTPLAQSITHSAFGVATTIIVTGLLNRVLDIVITRASAAWRLRRIGTSEDRARLLLRIPTIARAVAGAKAFVLVFVAVLSVFSQIGVPIGSVVTIGGLAAVALSLAAQNFVRDFLNGFLVLFEDQYVVGDYITINAFSGSVERLTLRMVQIRDAAGELITIPHSSVTSVVNGSRNWSRVDYRIPVDPGANISKAIEIVRQQIETVLADAEWAAEIGTPIEWIGIDTASRDGVVIRVSIKTAPLRQFELRREINAHVVAAFEHDGITLGAPLPP
jgi:small conductance mechanosensitive channel